MRRAPVPVSVLVSLIAMILLLAPACDTDQPLSEGEKNFGLDFSATQASAAVFDVWNYTRTRTGRGPRPERGLGHRRELDEGEDLNGDGILQLGEDVAPQNGVLDTGVWCEDTTLRSETPVPWSYSLQIDVIRSGSTEVTTVYTSGGLSDSFRTGPPTTPGPGHLPGKTVELVPRLEGGPGAWGDPIPLNVTNGQRPEQGNRILLDAPVGRSPVGLWGPNARSAWSTPQLGDPEIAGGPRPYTLQLNPGDTVQVQARKRPVGQSPASFGDVPRAWRRCPPSTARRSAPPGPTVTATMMGLVFPST